MRIYLLGFMASGKTTLGRQVSAFLEVPFFDTDQVIETQAGRSVQEIFSLHGESHFRQLEQDVLHQTAGFSKVLVATGGGLPLYGDNMDWMLAHGVTIYLEWPVDRLLEHVRTAVRGRPILEHLQTAEEINVLLQDRRPVYARAAMTLELEGELQSDLWRLEQACHYIW